MDGWEKAICRDIRRMHVYNVHVWLLGPSTLKNTQSRPSVTQTPCLLPLLSSSSSVVLRETIGKVSHFLCRAIAPQLLVSAPLPSLSALSPTHDSPLLSSPLKKKSAAATCWILQETPLLSVILQYFGLLFAGFLLFL